MIFKPQYSLIDLDKVIVRLSQAFMRMYLINIDVKKLSNLVLFIYCNVKKGKLQKLSTAMVYIQHAVRWRNFKQRTIWLLLFHTKSADLSLNAPSR